MSLASIQISNTCLGDPSIPTHDEFLAGMTSLKATPPVHLMWGSFQAHFEDLEESRMGEEFALIFHGPKVLGHGSDSRGEFFFKGKAVVAGTEEATQMKAAVSCVSTAGLDTEMSPYDGIMELRLEYSEDLSALPTALTQTITEGYLVGTWYTRITQDPNLGPEVQQGRVVLYATPHTSRTGGFFAVEFSTASCGLEHTGTFTHWHGTGAELRMVVDPAKSLGLRQNDVLKMVNGKPLPHKTKSSEISKILRNTPRPMVVHLWREPGSVSPEKDSPLDRKLEPLSLEVIDERQTVDSNMPLTASSAHTSNAGDSDSTEQTRMFSHNVRRVSSDTEDLKERMMGEILKKRTSLSNMRKEREERRTTMSLS